MTDKKKLVDRVKALIAKAESSNHPEEAQAFASKAKQLMDEHQVQLTDLGSDDPVIIKTNAFAQTDSSPSWYKDLFVALGMLYGCRAVQTPELLQTPTGKVRWGKIIELTGRESAIITAELMFPWVKKQCFTQGREIAKVTGKPPAKQARLVGNALVHRIYRLIAAEEARAEASRNQDLKALTQTQRNALVTIDEIDALFNDHYGDIGEARNSKTSTDALARQAANSIGLHRQAEGTTILQLEGK